MTDTPVDLDLLRVVRHVRQAKGACTVRDVAVQLGMSIPGTQHRIDRALEHGHLERTEVAGSLRIGVAAGNSDEVGIVGSDDRLLVITTGEGELLDARMLVE